MNNLLCFCSITIYSYFQVNIHVGLYFLIDSVLLFIPQQIERARYCSELTLKELYICKYYCLDFIVWLEVWPFIQLSPISIVTPVTLHTFSGKHILNPIVLGCAVIFGKYILHPIHQS